MAKKSPALGPRDLGPCVRVRVGELRVAKSNVSQGPGKPRALIK